MESASSKEPKNQIKTGAYRRGGTADVGETAARWTKVRGRRQAG